MVLINDSKEREVLWNQLRQSSEDVSYSWLVGGDFSNVMDMNKRVGGNEPTVVEMLAMKNCMQD